jgi:hypothetical protein
MGVLGVWKECRENEGNGGCQALARPAVRRVVVALRMESLRWTHKPARHWPGAPPYRVPTRRGGVRPHRPVTACTVNLYTCHPLARHSGGPPRPARHWPGAPPYRVPTRRGGVRPHRPVTWAFGCCVGSLWARRFPMFRPSVTAAARPARPVTRVFGCCVGSLWARRFPMFRPSVTAAGRRGRDSGRIRRFSGESVCRRRRRRRDQNRRRSRRKPGRESRTPANPTHRHPTGAKARGMKQHDEQSSE